MTGEEDSWVGLICRAPAQELHWETACHLVRWVSTFCVCAMAALAHQALRASATTATRKCRTARGALSMGGAHLSRSQLAPTWQHVGRPSFATSLPAIPQGCHSPCLTHCVHNLRWVGRPPTAGAPAVAPEAGLAFASTCCSALS